MTKTIALLGATGSIGRQTLEVAGELGLRVAALTANRQVDLLEQQARQFRPRLAVLYDPAAAKELRGRLRGTGIEVMEGPEGLTAAATLPEADTVVTAVMGSVGLAPTLAAIMEKKRIALSNKETLVCAGELVMAAARETGAEIVPVDSEHSAIFQCLQGCRDRGEVRRLLLTCSGGPFFGRSFDELEHVTAADALKHPNWTMGAKITIDSATLMNKGLEIIEAMRLYGLPAEQVEAVIHRQSIVHSAGGVPRRGHAGPAGYAGYEAAHPVRHDVSLSGGDTGQAAGSVVLRRTDVQRTGTWRRSPACASRGSARRRAARPAP